MAAVQRTDAVLVSPPGGWAIDKGRLQGDEVSAGDPVVIASDAPPNALWEQVVEKAEGTVAHGIALKDCKAGGTVEYAAEGEIDGFVGMTRGASLTIVGGVIDDTAAASEEDAKLRAVTPTRVRFRLL